MPRVGYVALIGRPNAGKSTLMNALIDERVSTISPRPQTTQRMIPGIWTDEAREAQIIFLDTPGIHEIKKAGWSPGKRTDIHERINTEAFRALYQADVIVRLIDPTRPPGVEDTRIDEVLSHIKKPIIRIETKQDIKNKPYPGKKIDLWVDSLSRIGLEELIEKIITHLPEWPYLYESDYYTDQTVEFRIQEVIREQIFAYLSEEIPYATYVEVGQVDTDKDHMRIQAYIFTESDSQKKILIGKWGRQITEIGMNARLTLEAIFWKKVFLGLRVKVMKNWRKNPQILAKLFPIQ